LLCATVPGPRSIYTHKPGGNQSGFKREERVFPDLTREVANRLGITSAEFKSGERVFPDLTPNPLPYREGGFHLYVGRRAEIRLRNGFPVKA